MVQFSSLVLLSLTPSFVPPSAATSAPPTPFAITPPAAQGVMSYGSTGAHGVLDVPAGTTRVINLAVEGSFDVANWVVRFDYVSVNIGNGATVSFQNHPSRAPVAWIVQGSVVIGTSANINLFGGNGTAGSPGSLGYSEPGPGGFRGGRSFATSASGDASAGFGPGGGMGSPSLTTYHGTSGSHATTGFSVGVSHSGPTYGSPAVFPLVGGSGGGSSRYSAVGYIGGGGAGGGAILIAADGTIDIDGRIWAYGGNATSGSLVSGAGAGGAIRIASLSQLRLLPSSHLNAMSGNIPGYGLYAGQGRIRLEAPARYLVTQGSTNPPPVLGDPQPAFLAAPPRVRVASIGGIPTPSESTLTAGMGYGGAAADMVLPFAPGAAAIVVETENVPLNSAVYLRITRARAHATLLGPLVLTSGTSVTFTNVDLSAGFSALQARIVLPEP